MEASKTEIKAIQGLSVLAMVCLHLFCRISYTYSPIIYIKGIPLCFYLAQASDFCVMGFAFCSAYGHSAILNKSTDNYYHNRLKSFLVLLVNYWIILVLFSFISIFIGNGASMPSTSAKTILGNVLIYNVSYNGAWWYLFTYFLIMLSSKPTINFVNKHNSILICISFAIVYTVSYFFRFKIQTSNWLIRQLYLYGMTLSEYVIGVLFYKHKIITRISKIPIKKKLWCVILPLGIIASLFVRTLIVRSLFVAPITGIYYILSVHLLCPNSKIFVFFGKHSTNIWLTHMFFYAVIFKDFIFIFKYPIFIFLAMLGITVIISYIVKLIMLPINNLWAVK